MFDLNFNYTGLHAAERAAEAFGDLLRGSLCIPWAWSPSYTGPRTMMVIGQAISAARAARGGLQLGEARSVRANGEQPVPTPAPAPTNSAGD
jgi:hypothetical protein